MLHKVAKKMAEYLQRELNLQNYRPSVITYGLEIFVGSIIKLITFLVVPTLLKIFSNTWVALLASGFFRLPSGGAHCTAYHRCLTGSLVVFSLIGEFSKLAMYHNIPVNAIFFVTLVLAVFAVAVWVPADTEVKPVTRLAERKRAKIWAYSVLFVYFWIGSCYDIRRDLLFAGTLGLLLQVFTVTPLGYKAMHKMDNMLAILF